jgi:hypothetical protein
VTLKINTRHTPRDAVAESAGHNTQFADYRAAGRFSAPRGETLLLFPPRHSVTFKTIHGEQAGKRDRGGSVGARHIVREHDTTQHVLDQCIKQGHKTSARPNSPWSQNERKAKQPLESLARGCSGSRFFCVPHRRTWGTPCRGEARAQSPARPSFDPDHALPFSN